MNKSYKRFSIRPLSKLTIRMPKQKVSAVLITYNESSDLPATLSRLNWCDEIIVVDSFSEDGTDKIAREFGCKLIQRTFTSFGEQKSFAVSQAKNDWILSLDSDEWLTRDLILEICQAMEDPGDFHAFAIRSSLFFRNQRFRYGHESARPVVRLFNKKFGHITNDRVHEQIQVKGKIKRLEGLLFHNSIRNIDQFLSKFGMYTAWSAEKYWEQGRRKSKSLILISIPFYFFKYYFLEKNILNGFNGFYWSALMAFYHFVKYLQLEDRFETTAEESSTIGKNFVPKQNRDETISIAK